MAVNQLNLSLSSSFYDIVVHLTDMAAHMRGGQKFLRGIFYVPDIILFKDHPAVKDNHFMMILREDMARHMQNNKAIQEIPDYIVCLRAEEISCIEARITSTPHG